MQNAGYASLQIIPSFKGFAGHLEKETSGALTKAGVAGGAKFGDAAGRSAGSRFGRLFVAGAKASMLGLVGAGALAVKFGKDAVGLAADFEQSFGAVNAVFDQSSKKIHRWAENAAMDVGLSANEFNELGTLIGSQLKNGGTAMDELAPKTRELITAGADMASMFGGTTREAVEALSSALKGERDPIERYGVSLNQAKIDAEAAELGFKKVDGALSNQATQAATLSLIMEQTADAHGNFARESDTLAGKQQRLAARFEDVKTKIGTALLPIITDATEYLLNKGVPAFERFADWFSDDGISGIKRFGGFVREEVLPPVQDLAEFGKDAAKVLGDIIKAVNDLPAPAKVAGLAALVGGGGALKLRSGKGALGTVGSALGIGGKGTPVYVTNWAQIAAGDAAPGGVIAGGGKGGKLRSAGRFASKAFLPATLFAAGYEAGGDEFGAGGRRPSIAGSGTESLIEQIDRVKSKAEEIPDSFREVLNQTAEEFKKADIPTELKTKIAMTGVPESMREAKALAFQYNLTPKQVHTLFELAGFDKLSSQIRWINSNLDYASRDRRTQITIAYANAGRQTLGGLQERANGGTVLGQRQPYGDKVLTWLAPGEEVISNRYGQADRHRALLKAINAGRYANGGTVQQVNFGRAVVDLRLPNGQVQSVELMTRVARTEIDRARRFDQIREGGR